MDSRGVVDLGFYLVMLTIRITTLSLNGNKLRRIDDSIGQIPSLTKLDLSNNELTELSPKIGNLTDLEGMQRLLAYVTHF